MLGKKSWNPYSPAAIARVRADEADAAEREESDDQKLQFYEAARRRAILKGETPPSPPTPPLDQARERRDDRKRVAQSSDHIGYNRKRRRLAGEDDTDRDIRLARGDEDARVQRRQDHGSTLANGKEKELSIVDGHGSIQLFLPPNETKPQSESQARHYSNRVQGKSLHRSRDKDGEVGQRFGDTGDSKSASSEPWYMTLRPQFSGTETISDLDTFSMGKDVFGRDDPNRRARDAMRLSVADPMAAIKKAQTRLKEVAHEKFEHENALREIRQEQEQTRENVKKHSTRKGPDGLKRPEPLRRHQRRRRRA